MTIGRDAVVDAPALIRPAAVSRRRRFLRVFRQSRLGMSGAILLSVVVFAALFAPWVAQQNPLSLNPAVRLRPPSAAHWFGTDDFGRDVFSRVVYGSRLSLEVGSLVVLSTAALGIFAGIAAGYFRVMDNVIMRVVDALLAIPPALLAIALMAVLGARVSNVVVSLTVAYVPQLTRVVRSQVLVLREAMFTEAAKSAGASQIRIAFLHVLPNSLSAVLVQSTVTFADAILTEAGLSYLGVGEPPGVPSWGNILSDGRNYMIQAPWMTMFPGVAIVTCVLGLNLLGDGLRDVLDPRLQER
jgi:peptide/nickel transport system permease protein